MLMFVSLLCNQYYLSASSVQHMNTVTIDGKTVQMPDSDVYDLLNNMANCLGIYYGVMRDEGFQEKHCEQALQSLKIKYRNDAHKVGTMTFSAFNVDSNQFWGRTIRKNEERYYKRFEDSLRKVKALHEKYNLKIISDATIRALATKKVAHNDDKDKKLKERKIVIDEFKKIFDIRGMAGKSVDEIMNPENKSRPNTATQSKKEDTKQVVNTYDKRSASAGLNNRSIHGVKNTNVNSSAINKTSLTPSPSQDSLLGVQNKNSTNRGNVADKKSLINTNNTVRQVGKKEYTPNRATSSSCQSSSSNYSSPRTLSGETQKYGIDKPKNKQNDPYKKANPTNQTQGHDKQISNSGSARGITVNQKKPLVSPQNKTDIGIIQSGQDASLSNDGSLNMNKIVVAGRDAYISDSDLRELLKNLVDCLYIYYDIACQYQSSQYNRFDRLKILQAIKEMYDRGSSHILNFNTQEGYKHSTYFWRCNRRRLWQSLNKIKKLYDACGLSNILSNATINDLIGTGQVQDGKKKQIIQEFSKVFNIRGVGGKSFDEIMNADKNNVKNNDKSKQNPQSDVASSVLSRGASLVDSKPQEGAANGFDDSGVKQSCALSQGTGTKEEQGVNTKSKQDKYTDASDLDRDTDSTNAINAQKRNQKDGRTVDLSHVKLDFGFEKQKDKLSDLMSRLSLLDERFRRVYGDKSNKFMELQRQKRNIEIELRSKNEYMRSDSESNDAIIKFKQFEIDGNKQNIRNMRADIDEYKDILAQIEYYLKRLKDDIVLLEYHKKLLNSEKSNLLQTIQETVRKNSGIENYVQTLQSCDTKSFADVDVEIKRMSESIAMIDAQLLEITNSGAPVDSLGKLNDLRSRLSSVMTKCETLLKFQSEVSTFASMFINTVNTYMQKEYDNSKTIESICREIVSRMKVHDMPSRLKRKFNEILYCFALKSVSGGMSNVFENRELNQVEAERYAKYDIGMSQDCGINLDNMNMFKRGVIERLEQEKYAKSLYDFASESDNERAFEDALNKFDCLDIFVCGAVKNYMILNNKDVQAKQETSKIHTGSIADDIIMLFKSIIGGDMRIMESEIDCVGRELNEVEQLIIDKDVFAKCDDSPSKSAGSSQKTNSYSQKYSTNTSGNVASNFGNSRSSNMSNTVKGKTSVSSASYYSSATKTSSSSGNFSYKANNSVALNCKP